MNKYFIKTIGYILVGLVVVALLPINNVSAFQQRGNTSAAKWISQSPGSASGGSTIVHATPGQVLNFSLTIKNTSKTDVFYSAAALQDEPAPYTGAHELRVGATNDVVYANIFDFSTGGPFVNNNRFVTFSYGRAVFPGDALTFNWSLKVRSGISNGSYRYAVGVVQEHDAWLGDAPGPGAGGTNNNLGGRSGGNIFWDIVIGGSSYTPSGNYLTYNNSKYGFTFNYPIPTPPSIFGFIETPNSERSLAQGGIGIPDTDATDFSCYVWRDTSFDNVVATVENDAILNRNTNGYSYTREYSTVNGLRVTAFKYHMAFADANVEERVIQLPSGYIFSARSAGWFNTDPDYALLNSINAYSTITSQTLSNSYIGVKVTYPIPYEVHGVGMMDYPTTSSTIQIYKDTGSGNLISIKRIYDETYGPSDEYPSYSLAAWADEIYQKNKNGSYPYTKSDLFLGSFAGRSAYEFDVQYNFWFRETSMFSLDSGSIYRAVLTTNNSGQKIAAYYRSGNSELKNIVDNLEFI